MTCESMHTRQFNVLNSINEAVIEASIQSLLHQLHLFELFDIKSPQLVLHVGGKAGGKEAALERFIQTFHRHTTKYSKGFNH